MQGPTHIFCYTNSSKKKRLLLIYGVYDFVVKVEAETLQNVKETITCKIRKIDSISLLDPHDF